MDLLDTGGHGERLRWRSKGFSLSRSFQGGGQHTGSGPPVKRHRDRSGHCGSSANGELPAVFHRRVRAAPSWYAIRSKRNAINRRAVEEFEPSKLSGMNYPNEPIFGVQPEPDKTSSPLFPTNPNASRAAPLPTSKAPAFARGSLSSRSGPDSVVDNPPNAPMPRLGPSVPDTNASVCSLPRRTSS